MGAVKKTISIPLEQAEFLKQQNLSLSKLIQKTIADAIDEYKFRKHLRKSFKAYDEGKFIEMSKEDFLKELKKW